nr:hypothetical protein Itr_chr04CG07840 [Ipomoea trifida]
MAVNSGDPNDPPLRAQSSEVIEVELFFPGFSLLLFLLDKPLFHLFSPVVRRLALSSRVSQLSSLPRRQLALIHRLHCSSGYNQPNTLLPLGKMRGAKKNRSANAP